ncbi:UDP-4-amino-4,6-dideoxy-N-acetyl-beta-L-altrosamine transaminase [endosymbiont of Ridgeia piscesae]|jgi:UDP-4-amino-4,6-dideoxy-N-acetyl-beta-L-altrosamine transaminase|uniref:UDP-4-amino-4, 6-dideoxy-N-acetyl-beta-L-altrosamine transaminase n=1 Tax=endosymbiont of Ridgeia piscesae TaxID=54398 RepID=A0A0T5Z0V5_9GAMM|nr:UDP-4-amino-4,6-dideoxy-N-acetyl-beta-L-altrosamine transaminase [endosymbiont of Ridgeia piscesae]KRT56289.1 UDP-4-amino-4,6-dideoxy-N-acetyl-beta-L-altrosamine transaminase [endosymbiont of Ridgeia piscesae]KRT56773.1 UDP-4-amino-4,6-dideoxy-N-acetyl-beta-L-altrosamine transaminase [endosymbiont of Ridgeia piscesae]
MIPYGHQSLDESDIDAVADVLRSDWLTQGPMAPRFGRAVADYCGAAHGVAMSSATAGLHLACLALGLGPGERLWSSPISFVASANCGRYCGAEVDFVDVEPASGNLSIDALERKLELAEQQGRLPKVLVTVHFAGQPVDLAGIDRLRVQYGFKLIEDAAHALGAGFADSRIGDCRYSDATVFSFHPVKPITSGEGGVLTTNDPELAAQVGRLLCHGISRDPALMQGESDGPWYYQQIELGYNYRMSDIQAALGLSQLQRLDQFVARRRALAERYERLLAGLPLTPLARLPGRQSGWHLYVVRLDAGAGITRRQLFEAMRAAGIGVQVHYIPIHLQPYYRDQGFAEGDLPGAEAFYQSVLTLPLYPELSEAQQDEVVEALRQALA